MRGAAIRQTPRPAPTSAVIHPSGTAAVCPSLVNGGDTVYHVVFLVARRPDMTPEAFADYWIGTHMPFTAKVPGVRAYRCYPAAGPQEGTPRFDGVAMLSFDDEAAYRAGVASPEFAAAIGDAPNFQDTVATSSFFAAEHVVV